MKKRYFYVLGSFAMLLLLGIAYAWSIFVNPLEQTYGWTRTETSLAFTILMMGFSLGCLFAGILSRKISYRTVAVIAAILVGAGFIATSFTSHISVLYVTYGACGGLGIGMIYNTIVSVIPLWFPDKKGMITGLLLMGFAMSTSILSPVCQKLLQTQGPKLTFLILGLINLIVFLLGSCMMKGPDAGELERLPGAAAVAASVQDYTTSQMLHSPRFYIYFLGANFLVMTALGYLNHVAPALQGELGISPSSAAYVVSAMSICNGLARPIAGQCIDRYGVKLSIRITCLIYAVASILGLFALSNRMNGLMIAAVCMLLFGYGCQGASLPCVIRALYGNKYFSMNFSIVSLVTLTASFCPSLVGRMQVASGSYFAGFLFMAVCCIASVPLMFAVRES